jgi:hypothetical protein
MFYYESMFYALKGSWQVMFALLYAKVCTGIRILYKRKRHVGNMLLKLENSNSQQMMMMMMMMMMIIIIIIIIIIIVMTSIFIIPQY